MKHFLIIFNQTIKYVDITFTLFSYLDDYYLVSQCGTFNNGKSNINIILISKS